MEDHDVHGLLGGVLIEGVGVTTWVTQTMGKAAQAEALFPDPHDGVTAAANEERDVRRTEVLKQGGTGVAPIHDEEGLAAGGQASGDQQQQGVFEGILALAELVVLKAGKS